MNTLHDDKTRQDLFSKPQDNDNYSPTVARDYENNETILYELTSGGMRVFPNFCMSGIFIDDKGLLRIYYGLGTIVIQGRNLKEVVKQLASKKIAIIRITATDEATIDTGSIFSIDSITFEEN